jgi:hypothetical protein
LRGWVKDPKLRAVRGRRLLLACGMALVACTHTRVPYAVVSPARDWTQHPAIVEVDSAPTLFALSDVHGGYDRLTALLVHNHILDVVPGRPEQARWSAGAAVLVVAGDMIDKGPSSVAVLDLFRALEASAPSAGGRVVVTLGNHEAEFLDDPGNDKATTSDGVDQDLAAHGLTGLAVANGSDVRGAWLRDRALGVRVGRWFFAHAGDTHGRTVRELEAALRAGITAHDYDDPEVIGGGSLLESRGWYDGDPAMGLRYAHAVSAEHIVFGHQPGALGAQGEIAVGQGGALFRIDCGMSPDVNYSAGRLLRVHEAAGFDIAESLDADGKAHEIWRGPIPAPEPTR